MNLDIIPWILNALLGIIMFLMKTTNDRSRADIIKLQADVEHLKEHKLSKPDFQEFKKELWQRFDKLEDAITKRT